MAISISKIDVMSEQELQKYFYEDSTDENGNVIKNYRWKFWKAYQESKDLDNQFLNFKDPISEVDDILDCLKEFEIKNFTVSTKHSNHLEVFWHFQNNGYIAKGMIQVKQYGITRVEKEDGTVDFLDYEIKPALYFSFE